MPLYFFNIHNHTGVTIDQEGADLPDVEAARARALDGIRSILAEEVRGGMLDLRGRIDVIDEGRTVAATIRYAEAVAVMPEGAGA
jgi:hypothetical protein